MTGLDLRDKAALQTRNAIHGYDGNHDIFDLENRTSNMETRYIIEGDWKLLEHHFSPTLFRAHNGVFTGKADNKEGKPELYNLIKDPHEKVNLAAQNPDQVKALQAKILKWWNS